MATGVNVKFAKCLIIFMSLCTLIEGVVYLALSVWGIAIQNCAIETPSFDSPFAFLVNFIYFQDSKCGQISFDLPNGEVLTPDMPDMTDVAYRTYIILIVYAAISGLWIIMSLTVLTALCSVINKTSYAVCLVPWLLVVIAGSILDAVATGFHVHDVIHTATGEDTLEYLDVKNAADILPYLADYEPYFITPAVVFTCISSRVVLVWILNIVGVAFSLSVAKDLINEDNDEFPDQRSAEFSFEHTVANPQVQRIAQPQPPPEGGRRNEVRTLEPLKMAADPVVDQSRPQSILRQQSSNKRVNELRTSAAPSQQSQLSPTSPSNGFEQASPSAPVISELSSQSPLNLRYSQHEGFPFQSQAHVTEGNRSQLPWSYINFREDPQARKQVMSHTQKNGDLTIIPVPDYTIHPAKRERQPLDRPTSYQLPPPPGGEATSRW